MLHYSPALGQHLLLLLLPFRERERNRLDLILPGVCLCVCVRSICDCRAGECVSDTIPQLAYISLLFGPPSVVLVPALIEQYTQISVFDHSVTLPTRVKSFTTTTREGETAGAGETQGKSVCQCLSVSHSINAHSTVSK